MSFIRAKEIPPRSGNWYDYEVKNTWDKGKVRQKVIRYIGKSGRTAMAGGSVKPISISENLTPEPPRIRKMKTPAKQIAAAMSMYYGGMPLDAIQQHFRQVYDADMSESNYSSLSVVITMTKSKTKNIIGHQFILEDSMSSLFKKVLYAAILIVFMLAIVTTFSGISNTVVVIILMALGFILFVVDMLSKITRNSPLKIGGLTRGEFYGILVIMVSYLMYLNTRIDSIYQIVVSLK